MLIKVIIIIIHSYSFIHPVIHYLAHESTLYFPDKDRPHRVRSNIRCDIYDDRPLPIQIHASFNELLQVSETQHTDNVFITHQSTTTVVAATHDLLI